LRALGKKAKRPATSPAKNSRAPENEAEKPVNRRYPLPGAKPPPNAKQWVCTHTSKFFRKSVFDNDAGYARYAGIKTLNRTHGPFTIEVEDCKSCGTPRDDVFKKRTLGTFSVKVGENLQEYANYLKKFEIWWRAWEKIREGVEPKKERGIWTKSTKEIKSLLRPKETISDIHCEFATLHKNWGMQHLLSYIRYNTVEDIDKLLTASESTSFKDVDFSKLEINTPLNLAAVLKDPNAMACLVERGITQWKECKSGNETFEKLIKGSKAEDAEDCLNGKSLLQDRLLFMLTIKSRVS
jgi:hypothetical protein